MKNFKFDENGCTFIEVVHDIYTCSFMDQAIVDIQDASNAMRR